MNSTYTTPPTVPGDNDSQFSVTISNPLMSITSKKARLVLNPPKAGDLRFQQVDAPSTIDAYAGVLSQNILIGSVTTWTDYGSPLRLDSLGHCSSTDCAWFFQVFSTPSLDLTTRYKGGTLSNFAADLKALPTNTVLTSLDVEPANNAYGTSLVAANAGGPFTPVTSGSVLPADFPAVVAQEGSLGHVITAVAFNAGMVTYVSYGWQGDPNTVYDTTVATATLNMIGNQAASLAQSGYILTAAGGNNANGYLLVGTRVQGDSMPRPFIAVNSATQDSLTLLFNGGYALVSVISNADHTITWLGEK